MSQATLDRLLAVLLAAVLVTGVLTWRAGSPDTHWLYVLHGVTAGVLLAAFALKLVRSLPPALRNRRWRRLSVALPLAAATLLSLAAGFAWVAGGTLVELGPWTLLGWHGIFAWAIVALIVVHLLGRRWRLLRPRRPLLARPDRPTIASRRALLAGGALGLFGFLAWGAAEALDRLGQAPRRFTGSRWLPAGGVPPPTTFFGEGTPLIDPAAWRLRVNGAVDAPSELTLPELEALGVEERNVTLDCTGGWAIDTTWRGVPLATLLYAVGARPTATKVAVRSVTGWGASLDIDEARGCLLATGVAGIALPAGNGAPCRLVVPNRRGLDWVKWVAEVTVA